MQQILTSVVIPAYNAEDYLQRTLWSALGQTHRKVEVIVVNDGSTDSTESLAKAVASRDARVQVITTENKGVAHARNTGLAAASGEYVAFLDADDLWHETKIEAQLSAIAAAGSYKPVASYTRMRIIDEDDQVVRNGSGISLSGHTYVRHLFARPVGNGSSILARREVAVEVGGFDSSWMEHGVGGCEDLDFELKIASRYAVVAVPQYLVGYRSYPGNMSSNSLALARAVLATVESHLAANPELPHWAIKLIRTSTAEFALQNLALARRWDMFLAELWRLHRIDLRRGVEYAARFAARKVVRDKLRIRQKSLPYHKRPQFYLLDPALDAGMSVRRTRARDRKVIEELGVLDAVLAESRVSKR